MENKPAKVRQNTAFEIAREKIIGAIAENPNQDPCVTIEGSLVQTGEPHLRLALTLIQMVNFEEVSRTKEGLWQVNQITEEPISSAI